MAVSDGGAQRADVVFEDGKRVYVVADQNCTLLHALQSVRAARGKSVVEMSSPR